MKNILITLIAVCAIALCALFCACGGVSKQDYDKLNSQYNEVLQEKENLEKISNWLDLYKSIEMDKSFEEVYEKFGFLYATRDMSYVEDGYTMTAYTWRNDELFDYAHTAENQIVVVFRDNKAIYKQYGNAAFVLNNYDGTVYFPMTYS